MVGWSRKGKVGSALRPSEELESNFCQWENGMCFLKKMFFP